MLRVLAWERRCMHESNLSALVRAPSDRTVVRLLVREMTSISEGGADTCVSVSASRHLRVRECEAHRC
jgi:hypothetical protein